ncbi:MAG: Flp pilus assembly protein CpaB [Eubacteriaceae bacterium]
MIKKKLNKQTIIGLVSLFLTAVIILLFIPIITGVIGNTTKVAVVTKTITVGEILSKDNIEMVEKSNYNLPSNVFKSMEEVEGMYATARLEPGEVVMDSKVVSNLISSGNYRDTLDGSKRIISVSINSLSDGISGKLQANDIVSIYNNEESANERATVYNELKYVKVLAVTSASGIELGGDEVSDEESLPATVTLLVNENQAQLLSGLETNGNIFFSLVWPASSDQSVADSFLSEQDNYFTNDGKI